MSAFPQPLVVAACIAALGASPAAQFPGFREVHRMLPADASETVDLALGDLDGDGDLDILTSGDELLLLGDGTGVFSSGSALVSQFINSFEALALGDLDGDGDLDAYLARDAVCIVGLGCFGGQDSLLFGGGEGFVETSFTLPVDKDPAKAVALGDVDGDGDLDALIGHGAIDFPTTPNRLVTNTGVGVFLDASTQIPQVEADTRAVVFGDVDGDGDLDGVVGNRLQQNRLYQNSGAGGFSDGAGLPPDADATQALALGDVDGDGDLDVLVGNGEGTNRLYLNAGAGAFVDAPTALPTDADDTTDVALIDADADGDLDAVFAGSAQPDRLYRNVGGGTFAEVLGALPGEPVRSLALAVGDVDGDSDADLLVGVGPAEPLGDGDERLYLGDGLGSFSDVTSTAPDGLAPSAAVALGDVDGDGDVDAFVGNGGETGGDAVNRLYLGDGTGAFASAPPLLPGVADQTLDVELFDVDGDGDLDALVANAAEQANRLLANDGGGAFAEAPLPDEAQSTADAELGDLDGDGAPDLLLANFGPPASPQNRLYLGDGLGGFADATSLLPPDADATWAVAFADVDADGDLDALLGNDGPNRIYLNDGAAGFLAGLGQIPAGGAGARAVVLGDFDLDGDADAIVATVGANELYLGDGAGAFAASPASLGGDTRSLAVGDVDEDGDLDVVLDVGRATELYLGDGAGGFAAATELVAGVRSEVQAVALADLDGDEDLDVFVARAGRNRVLANLRRQTAWRAVPRVGKALTIDVNGPPVSPFFLAFSTATDVTGVPGVGVLLLDPAGLVLLPALGLDAAGEGSVTAPIPASTALVGLSLYWQALVGLPVRFANLERTTLTGL
ncbi:MAG: VCBS repeat-containing protein [Planctomycetota bacterium]